MIFYFGPVSIIFFDSLNEAYVIMLKSLFASSDSDSDSDSDKSVHQDIENSNILENNSTNNDEYLDYTSSNGQITIKLKQQKQLGIAHQLWPAASFLCRYLETNLNSLYPTQSSFNVLELGAGLGLCGIFISKLPMINKVIITDLDCVQDLLRENIQLNCSPEIDAISSSISSMNSNSAVDSKDIDTSINTSSSSSPTSSNTSNINSDKVCSEVLCWGISADVDRSLRLFPTLLPTSQLPLLVIASDCVYWEHLFQPLYDTLLYLINHYKCHIIISHVRRWKRDAKFFQMCSKTMLVEKLHEELDYITEEFDGSKRRRLQRIYRIQAKQLV